MAQFAWNVKTEGGRPWLIGLLHGEQDGHVLLYCNNTVTQIDFNVRESKTYSLLLDEVLCRVSINLLPDGSYRYDCELDDTKAKARAAARRQARELERKDERFRLQLGLGFVALILLLLWWFSI